MNLRGSERFAVLNCNDQGQHGGSLPNYDMGCPRLWCLWVMLQPFPSFGVEPEQMRTPYLILKVLLVTAAAVTAAYYAIASVNVSGLMSTNFCAADVIRERCPLHLVQPEWIAGTDQVDILLRWPITEMKARLAVLLVLWVFSVSIFAVQFRRRHR